MSTSQGSFAPCATSLRPPLVEGPADDGVGVDFLAVVLGGGDASGTEGLDDEGFLRVQDPRVHRAGRVDHPAHEIVEGLGVAFGAEDEEAFAADSPPSVPRPRVRIWKPQCSAPADMPSNDTPSSRGTSPGGSSATRREAVLP